MSIYAPLIHVSSSSYYSTLLPLNFLGSWTYGHMGLWVLVFLLGLLFPISLFAYQPICLMIFCLYSSAILVQCFHCYLNFSCIVQFSRCISDEPFVFLLGLSSGKWSQISGFLSSTLRLNSQFPVFWVLSLTKPYGLWKLISVRFLLVGFRISTA